jgi:hypothetical protein
MGQEIDLRDRKSVGRIYEEATVPELKQRFEAVGGELMEVSPDRLNGIIKADYDRWNAIIRAAGIRLE